MLPAGKVEVARRLARRSRRARSGCVVWRGAVQSRGYGCLSVGAGKIALAHRVAYFLAHGEIDAALTIDHLCRNRRCVNPAHMEQVTAAENIRRGESLPARNARKTHCHRGHELSGENLIAHANGRRNCRECQRGHEKATQRRYAARLCAARATLGAAS